jgi:nicotinamidase-related amidase
MLDNGYDKDQTALLIVDPYNDFMSEGGKLYEAINGARTFSELESAVHRGCAERG